MEIAVFWIAIWGAVSSTILGIIRIIDFRRDRPDIRVKVQYAYFYSSGGTVSDSPQLSVTAINRGRRKVKLERAGLSLSNGTHFPWVSDPSGIRFPQELGEADSKVVFFEVAGMKNALKDMPGVYVTHAFFYDSVGRPHRRKLSTKMRKQLQT